jgi:hypothetical protein
LAVLISSSARARVLCTVLYVHLYAAAIYISPYYLISRFLSVKFKNKLAANI